MKAFGFIGKTQGPGRSRYFFMADSDPEGINSIAIAGVAEDSSPDCLGASFICERLLAKAEEKGLSLCGLSFEELKEELSLWLVTSLDLLETVGKAKGLEFEASVTLAAFTGGSWLCLQKGSPQCFVESGGILRRITLFPKEKLPCAGSFDRPCFGPDENGLLVFDGLAPGSARLFLCCEDAAGLLPFPLIQEKLAVPSEKALAELEKLSLRLGAAAGGSFVCLDPEGGEDTWSA